MKSLCLSAAFAMAALSTPISAQQSYPPRDECRGDAAAQAFRYTLTTAVANRNAAMLRPLVAPQVELDFGGGSGWETFAARLDDPAYTLWEELDRVLLLGCAVMKGGELTLPWHWAQDFGDIDYFETMLVTGSDVPLRVAAAPDAPVRARIHWELVTLIEGWDPEAGYLKVRDGLHRTGFIRSDRLRSMVDYRLLARPGTAGYRIIAFIAGD
ncbi:MAG: hypothetical protein ABGW84_05245 [Sphingomonadaceae bacterium]